MIMLSYSNLRSHPNKRLETHLLNVAKLSKNVFDNLNIENKSFYAELSFLIGISHDFAKSTTWFQDKLPQEEVVQDKSPKEETKKAWHSHLSAIFGYYVIQNFLENHIKKDNIEFDHASIALIVILKHHGDLSNINNIIKSLSENEGLVKKQIENIRSNLLTNSLKDFYLKFGVVLNDFIENFEVIFEILRSNLKDLQKKKNLDIYFNVLLLYSVLLDSDKMDASETKFPPRVQLDKNIVDLYKKNKFESEGDGVNKIRNKAYNEIIFNMSNIDLNKRIYSINLPTGTGKTLSAFSAALKLRYNIQKELNFTPRIIYSLPFLSIIDQNAEVFLDILKNWNEVTGKNKIIGHNVLLKHNSLSDMTYKIPNEDEISLDNAEILIEGWNSEIIITTFIQFFYSLISRKNRSIRKFHNMANSIIILDEIQSVPYEYWKIINLMLKKLAYEFNSWVILMTATQPLIFSEKENEVTPLVKNKDYYYGNFDRFDYNFDLENVSFDEFKDKVLSEINSSYKNFMFVLNTIDSSKDLYEFIKDDFSSRGFDLELDKENGIVYNDKIELVYLSTNIVPCHRLSRINHIKNSEKRKIIISTQLIEAGVDISVDVIYRDFAPMDSIIQTAGRCNRNDADDKGIINVVSLTNEENKPFSNFVYDTFLLNKTRGVIEDIARNSLDKDGSKQDSRKLITFSEKKFNHDAIEKYYHCLKEDGSDKDSNDLINTIERLNFNKIPLKFKLINKDDTKKIDVFVGVNKESKDLWAKYDEILKSEDDFFERKKSFLSIKSEFYKYVISVYKKDFGFVISKDGRLAYISMDEEYDLETGFIKEEERRKKPRII